MSRGKRRINAIKRLRILRTHVWRGPHASEQDSYVTGRQPAQNGIERSLGDVGIEAAQRIVCTQFDNDRVGPVRN
jgi:hypothetical protein